MPSSKLVTEFLLTKVPALRPPVISKLALILKLATLWRCSIVIGIA